MIDFNLNNSPPSDKQLRDEHKLYRVRRGWLASIYVFLYFVAFLVFAVVSDFYPVKNASFFGLGTVDMVTDHILLSATFPVLSGGLVGVGWFIGSAGRQWLNNHFKLTLYDFMKVVSTMACFATLIPTLLIIIQFMKPGDPFNTTTALLNCAGYVIAVAFTLSHLGLDSFFKDKIWGLTYIERDDLRNSRVIDICRQFEECDSYRRVVANTQRPLTNAEVKLILSWSFAPDAKREAINKVAKARTANAVLKSTGRLYKEA